MLARVITLLFVSALVVLAHELDLDSGRMLRVERATCNGCRHPQRLTAKKHPKKVPKAKHHVKHAHPHKSTSPAKASSLSVGSFPSSTSSAPPMSPTGTMTGTLEAQAIQLHNAFRAKHAAPPMKWNATMASLAQSWVNKCVFAHSGGSLGPLGENIAAGYADMAAAFGGWTTSGSPSEEQQYNPSNPQASHFTQVVWKASTQLGCAVAQCNMPNLNADGLSAFYACEYFVAGNVYLEGSNPNKLFQENVTP